MFLAATSQTLEAFLAAAPAATQPTVVVDWADLTSSSLTGGMTPNNLNGTTAVTILAAPASGTTRRKVNYISIYNRDTAPVVVQVRLNDNTTMYPMIRVTLDPDDTLLFTDTRGWYVINSLGQEKSPDMPSGMLIRAPQVFTVVGANTYTTPANCHRIRVRAVGGGGGGGGTTTAAVSAALGGGGGSGAYAEDWLDVIPSTSYAIQVGAAGSAGSSAGGAGGSGGATTFTHPMNTITCDGGNGGTGMTAGTAVATSAGGSGGSLGSGEDVASGGGPGQASLRSSGTVGYSGDGASSPFGGGGPGRVSAGAGNAGVGKGSGGGGGAVLNGSGAVTGGAGASGMVIVEEYT